MLSYELGYWWTDCVVEIYEGSSQRVGKQIFISELTQNLYFLGHWTAVDSGDGAARRASSIEIGFDRVGTNHGNGGLGSIDIGDGVHIALAVGKPVAFVRLSHQAHLDAERQ